MSIDRNIIEKLKFDEKGLIPCVVQDFRTGEILTLAYMNRESLEISINEGRTCFFSRSRNELWRKGETSGNYQSIIKITADCDFDAITVTVDKNGPACHTGEESCFNSTLFESDSTEKDAKHCKDFSLDVLYELVKSRKIDKKEGSYTTYLFEKGIDKILKKIGEEASEVIIAAKNNDKAETIFEISDFAYHALVLMVEMGISVEDILSELESRHIVDHKVKQEKMK